ncbi:MAG: hypothetical protein MUC42_11040 [Bryobacter sp.]|nr:hypothetical protein [Bryobacter sp.]
MVCQLCGKKIGVLRSLTDREFCSTEHRKLARRVSARYARESALYGEYVYDDDLPVVSRRNHSDPKRREQLAKIQAGGALAISMVLIFVLVFSWSSSEGGGGGGNPLAQNNLMGEIAGKERSSAVAGILEAIKRTFPSTPPTRLQDTFQASLNDWVVTNGRRSPLLGAGDWSVREGMVRPGRIRLWQPSLKLADYRFDFDGQIERKGMSWAFRAPNIRNFYATKISVRKTSPEPTYEIVRYSVVNGVEGTRTKLPLPFTLPTSTTWHVEMRVRGDRFSTMVNGQVVDTWSDDRLKAGGVGFFSEPGETAAIHNVNLVESRPSFLDRVFSLGFFLPPQMMAVPLH